MKPFDKLAARTRSAAEQRLMSQLDSATTIAGFLAVLRDDWVRDLGVGRGPVAATALFRQRFPGEELVADVLEFLLGVPEARAAPQNALQAAASLLGRPDVRVEIACCRARVFADEQPLRAFAALWRAFDADASGYVRVAVVRMITELVQGLLARIDSDRQDVSYPARVVSAFMGIALVAGLREAPMHWQDAPLRSQDRGRLDELTHSLVARGVRACALAEAQLGMVERLRSSVPREFLAEQDALAQLGEALAELRVDGFRDETEDDADKDPEEREHWRSSRHDLANRVQSEHRNRLTTLGSYYAALAAEYDDYLPWEEYLAERELQPQARVLRYRRLFARHPECTYHAYRIACGLDEAGDHAAAQPYWIHAARVLGPDPRSEVASVIATLHSFTFEARRLGNVSPIRRIPGFKALSAHLQARAETARSLGFITAEYGLTERAARLAHAVAFGDPDAEERRRFADRARHLYLAIDDEQGAESVLSKEPADPLDVRPPPLWHAPL